MPHHVGYEDALNLTISLCLTYTLCISCVRIWIRKAAYGADDVVIAIATVVTLCHTATDYISLSAGLGTPWTSLQQQARLDDLNKASVAGVVLFFVALYLSKCSMLSFLARITKTPSQIRLYHACNAAVAGVGVVSILIVTVDCPSKVGYYWAFHANSPGANQSARWQAITALDIITEILLLLLPIQLVWHLQMPRRKKAVVLIAFLLRLPVLGFSIGRNYYTLQLRLPQTDPGLKSAVVVIWLEVELAYALAASTLSALKAFTESFNSDFGLGFTRGKGDGSYGMSNISGDSSNSATKAEKAKHPSRLESHAGSSHLRSPPLEQSKNHFEIVMSPISAAIEGSDVQPLKLRPEGEFSTVTCVLAESMLTEPGPWRDISCTGSDSAAGDDMVVMCETGYEVQHDRKPMLPIGGVSV